LPAGPSLPPLAQTIAYHRDPLGVLRRTRARFGPVFTLRLSVKGPLVFVALPEAVPRLLESDPDRASAGAARRRILPQASPRSPFGADDEAYRATHARMAPALSPAAIASLEPAIAAIAERHVASWPLGRPFRLLEAMRSLCTEVFTRTVLAVDDEPRGTAVAAGVRRTLRTPGNPPLPLPGEGDGTLGGAGDAIFAQRREPLVAALAAEVESRRGAPPRDDLLGRMVAADPPLATQEIVDELLVVLMAAQEPPAIALTNVLLELARHREAEERYAAGGDGVREAAVAEALRLRPAASAALRRLDGDETVGETVLPAGTVVALPSPLLHRDPAAFPEPDAFRPERFAEGAPPGAPYLPFGAGARRCIGEPLGRALLRIVPSLAVERLRVHPAWPRPERMVVRGTVLAPHRSGLVRATSR
jgi:cytochrome P450